MWLLLTILTSWQPIGIYQTVAPLSWHREPFVERKDTTMPLAEFRIEDAIQVVVHSFPVIGQNIPPEAQVVRWQKQFDWLDQTSIVHQPQAFSGFVGLYWEGIGREQHVMAWALELAPEHRRFLKNQEMGADVTIKVTGPKGLVKKHKEAITAFARSFELLDDLP